MRQQEKKHITLSRNTLIAALVLALTTGGAIVYFMLPDKTATPPLTQITPAPALPTVTTTPPSKPAKPVEKKTQQALSKPARPTKQGNEFLIQGLLSPAGEPWAANMIMVKILWLKNQNNKQFLLGQETSMVQDTANGFAYRIVLKPQSKHYLNWNGGVEGNVGRVIAFLDHKRDGRLTLGKDKIIAVSKELVRYRTGRYDKNILNETQQQNIRQAGKGYVIVSNQQVDENTTDWQVVASESPARLDLNVAETSLPGMYNTFMKLQ